MEAEMGREDLRVQQQWQGRRCCRFRPSTRKQCYGRFIQQPSDVQPFFSPWQENKSATAWVIVDGDCQCAFGTIQFELDRSSSCMPSPDTVMPMPSRFLLRDKRLLRYLSSRIPTPGVRLRTECV